MGAKVSLECFFEVDGADAEEEHDVEGVDFAHPVVFFMNPRAKRYFGISRMSSSSDIVGK